MHRSIFRSFFIAVPIAAAGFLLACQTLAPKREPSANSTDLTSLPYFLNSYPPADKVKEALQKPFDKARLCTDPYAAIAERGEVKDLVTDLAKEWKERAKKARASARSDFAQVYGYWGFTDYLLEEFRRSGFVVSEDAVKQYVESLAANNSGALKTETDGYCQSEKNGWYLGYYSSSLNKTPQQFGNYLERLKKFSRRWSAEMREYAKQSPLAYLQSLSAACQDLETTLAKPPEKANTENGKKYLAYLTSLQKLPLCSNTLQVRVVAADVVRREKIEFTEAELAQWVDPYLPVLTADTSVDVNPASEDAVPEAFEYLLEEAKVYNTCSFVEKLQTSAASLTTTRIIGDMDRSQEYRNTLAREFYSEWDGKRVADAAFNVAQEGVLKGIGTLTNNVGEADKLRTSVGEVKLQWPMVKDWPVVESTNWAGKTMKMIDELKIDQDDPYWYHKKVMTDDAANAFYVPIKKQIFLYPGIVWFGNKAPASLVAVLAHEIGHDLARNQLGKKEASIFQNTLNCMTENLSIKYQPDQWSESIADIVASAAMANLFAAVKPEDRAGRVAESMLFYHYTSLKENEFAFNEEHAFDVFRVSGIEGASKGYQALLNCEGKSKYKTCF